MQLNARNESGDSPLAGQSTGGKFLISQAADVNGRNDEGNTALHGAAFLECLGVVDVLLGNGADVNAGNTEGNTAFDVVVEPWIDALHEPVVFVAG